MSIETNENKDIIEEHVLITAEHNDNGGTLYTCYLDKGIGEAHLYRNLLEFLRRASEEDEFHLVLNGPGGHLYTCIQIVHAIKDTAAHVTGVLVGEACSAHANIFIVCHSHIVHDYASLMIHTLTGSSWGKGHDITRMGKALNETARIMYEDLYRGFLTEEELLNVLNNNKDDWYVGRDEILSRLEVVHSVRSRELTEINNEVLRNAEDEVITQAERILAERNQE